MNPPEHPEGTPSPVGYTSKIDMVTAVLRAQITSGQIAPGEQLRQRSVAEALSVSVTPVREALRRLEIEGLVRYDVHCGATVVEVDFGPTEENFLIRAALEGLATSMAAHHVTDAQVEELVALQAAMRSTEPGDRLVALNRDFHLHIYEFADAPLLNSLIRRLWLSFGGGPLLREGFDTSLAQHDAIIAALREHDPEAAEEAARLHVLTGLKRAGFDTHEYATNALERAAQRLADASVPAR